MKTFKEFVNEEYNRFYVKDKDGKTVSVHTDTAAAFAAAKAEHHVTNAMGEKLSKKSGLPESFEPKERFVPAEGKECRVPADKVGQTITGKILRQARTKGQWQVKTKEGDIGSYTEDELFDTSLGCEQYAKYKWSK